MRRVGGLPALTLLLAAPVAAAPPASFTEEAVARGLVYAVQSYPQSDGYLGFGCGFVDLDADGDADVVVLGAADGHVGLFENDGTGHFTDRSAGSGIAALDEASAFAAADVDGDGLLDLFLSQVGVANRLYRNLGGFVFTDVTATGGLGDAGAGKGAAFGDYDGDGRVDLYVTNYEGEANGFPNRLYHNLGGFGFAEVGAVQGVDDSGHGFQAVWSDYDRDGDVDLYLSNDRGHLPPSFLGNRLWRNDDGSFVDVSVGSGADVHLFSMGLAAGDFDGNGWPDFYVTNVHGPSPPNANLLLLNQGDGTFLESSAAAGVQNLSTTTSWGAIFFDWDNDGHQDLYVNNQFDENSLYDCNGTFPCSEIAADVGVTGRHGGSNVSFSSAVADVDGDGDLDLLENNLTGNVELFVNHEGENRDWVRFRVLGRGSDPWAIGARVEVRVGAVWRMREVLAGGNGYLGQNELTVHIGLDTAAVLDEVIASWPGGAPTRTLTGLAASQTWTIFPPERLGDIDGDGACRRHDFLTLAACYLATFGPGCEGVDFDGDGDVDAADAAAFLATYDDPAFDLDANGVHDLEQILADPALDLDGDGLLDAFTFFADDFETGDASRWSSVVPPS